MSVPSLGYSSRTTSASGLYTHEEMRALQITVLPLGGNNSQPTASAEAIEAKFRPTVEQYDRRVACYERLKNYNAALKDSREMIRFNRQDIKGYLRMGSILQKVNKLRSPGHWRKICIEPPPLVLGEKACSVCISREWTGFCSRKRNWKTIWCQDWQNSSPGIGCGSRSCRHHPQDQDRCSGKLCTEQNGDSKGYLCKVAYR